MCDVSGQAFPVFTFTKSNINDNLPIDALAFIIEDKKGFLWISTLKGLCRYDGNMVKVFKNERDNKNSIANDEVGFVDEDANGNLWIAQQKGISCYNRNKNSFINYTYYINKNKDTIPLNYNGMLCTTNGDIIYQNGNFINNAYFDKKENCFKEIIIDTTNDGNNNKEFSNQLVGYLRDAGNKKDLYLIGVNGLFNYDLKTGAKKRITKSSIYSPLDIHRDYLGQLWMGEWGGGLSLINEKTGKKQIIIPNKTVTYFSDYKDANGKWWLLADEWKTNSLVIIDPITKKYIIQPISIENQRTPSVTPGKILCTNNGKIYITTSNGLIEAAEKSQIFTNVFTYKIGEVTDIFYDNLIRSGTTLHNGDYVFGKLGVNGILVYDSNLVLKKEIKNYTYNGKNYDVDVKSFCKINEQQFLLTGQTGVAIYDNGKIKPFLYSPKKESNSGSLTTRLRDALPMDEENYWIRLLNDGIVLYNIKSNSIIKSFTKAKDNIPLGDIFAIKYDQNKNLWATSDAHIFMYNKQTNQFEIQPINIGSKYLSNIRNFCFDAQHNLWITGVGGLLNYNFTKKQEILYNTSNGLKEESTFKVLPYDSSSVILIHKTGLAIFNYRNNIFTNINNKEGLSYNINEYDGCFLLDKNKNILIGNSGLITKINIADYLNLPISPTRVSITQIEGSNNDEEIFIENNIKKTNLNFKNFPVNILFSIINFTGAEEKIFYYRYAGKDTTWLKCNNGVVPINTITPGTYIIEVTASIDGKFIATKDNITFTIIPRWFETLWFKIIAGLLSLFIIISLYRWRIKTAQKSQKQQTEIQRLAAQEYKNQLELAQISNYFSTSLINLETEEEVLWDVAKNLIGKLGFEDCIIYLWNKDKTKLVQRAGYGPKGSIEEINKQPFDVVLGQGVVGYVAQTKEPVLINDTRKDARYRVDEMSRLSEICVPILHENELVGVIDSEHTDANFYTKNNLQSLINIAAYLANKLADIKSKQAIQKNSEELQKTLDLLKGAQLEALRSQMNPHFIFNCLNSIKLYTTQNDTVAASNYLTKFSKLIRLALENSKSETIPLSTELEALELYIEMEAMRFKEKLKYSIIINENVDADFIEIPPLLLQPYVENSIWHGLMHKEEGGRIDIHIGIVPQKYILEITIKDDGVGREKAAFLKSKSATSHKSFGTKVTSDRLEIVNQLYKTGASVHTEDVMTNNVVTGTLVTLRVPFE
jgi:LytS/YehU family sensor histidine kinase/ligand-binding sensor domain-containing protein